MESKVSLIKITLGILLVLVLLFLEYIKLFPSFISLLLALVAMFFIASSVFYKAVIDLRHLDFSENVLMSIGAIAAIIIGQYPEGLSILVFYIIGEKFEGYARDKSRSIIESLATLRPKVAHLYQGNELIDVKPKKVKVDDQICVLKGESVPIDAVLLSDVAVLNLSAITGESVPITYRKGEGIVSGAINEGEKFDCRVSKLYQDSTISNLLNLVENASIAKSKHENFIRHFARYYTPIVIGIAFMLLLTPLVIKEASFYDYANRALVFLVTSCPCALLLAIPLAFFGGIGVLAKKRILVKGSKYISALSKLNYLALDKTGTLTKGDFTVSDIYTAISVDRLLYLVYSLEQYSNHPLAKSIVAEFGAFIKDNKAKITENSLFNIINLPSINTCIAANIQNASFSEINELVGYGIKGKIFNEELYLVNERYLKENLNLTPLDNLKDSLAVIYVTTKTQILGVIVLKDKVKDEAAKFVQIAKNLGVELELLSGDKENIVKEIAKEFAIDKAYGAMKPEDKLSHVAKVTATNNYVVGFVGDGINDAPVITCADVGFAMGKRGQAIAIDVADVIITNDNLFKVLEAKLIAKRLMKLITFLLVLILSVKFIILGLGFFGFASIWLAIFGDVGLTVIAVLLAMVTFTERFGIIEIT